MNSAPSPVKQWMSFPPAPVCPDGNSHGIRIYRALVEMHGGQLLFLKMDLPAAPDTLLIARIVEIHRSEDRMPMANRRDFAWLLEEGLRIKARVIDDDICDDASWHISDAIPDALRSAIRGQSDRATLLSISRSSIERDLSAELKRRREVFVGSLNQMVVSTVQRVGLFPSTYNQLACKDPVVCRNRCQAFDIFPMLIQGRLSQWRNEAIRHAIDEGKPLIEELSAFYAVPKSVVRCIRGVRTSALGDLGVGFGNLLRLLNDIPPDWRPSSVEQWKSFSEAAILISRISRRPITAPSNRLWLKICAENGYEVQNLSREEAIRSAFELEELSNALCKALSWSLRDLYPNGKIEAAGAKAFGQMMSSLGIFRIASIALKWGNAYRRTLNHATHSALAWDGTRWPSLSAIPVEVGQVVARPLLGTKELTEEGRQMKHCVARHAGDCALGRCQIWSLASGGGEGRSTLQTFVDVDSGGGHDVRIGEHRGKSNVKPPPVCKVAAAELIVELKRQTAQTEQYVAWQQSVASVGMEERFLYAAAQPIIVAFEQTLPKAWSYARLIEVGRTYANSD